VAALLGARVVVPDGATGGPSTQLEAKADAALAALAAGAPRVVVHVGGADEAAHVLDAAGKVAFLERADRELIAPLAAALRHGTLRVCPDHGCDPATGAHDADPVPHLTWRPGGSDRGRRRLTERAVAALDVTDLTGTR
jgi:2,3-bisphosphoglycerate-independent phosphoglycerate mutase